MNLYDDDDDDEKLTENIKKIQISIHMKLINYFIGIFRAMNEIGE